MPAESDGSLRLSVVLPVYNEVDNLRPLHAEITGVLQEQIDGDYEILYCDDGSTDGSRQLLETIAAEDPHVRVICFWRNFGQTAAVCAGVDHSAGEIIVLMDADGQNDPADIPRMLARIEQGDDVVSGWRRDRQDGWILRRVPSMIANRLIGAVTGLELHDFGCTLKAYRGLFLKRISLYGDMHRFIPVFAHWLGAKVSEMEVHHRPRTRGVSKYGIGRTFRVIIDIVVLKMLGDFRTRPSHFFGGIGLSLQAGGVLCGCWVVYQKLGLGIWAHKNPLLLLAVFLFLTGLNLLMMGLLAEILIRIYFESQGKPIYHIRSETGFETPPSQASATRGT